MTTDASLEGEGAVTDVRYKVVANDEDQYSVWAEDQPSPAGWRDVGVAGSKARCLDHIEQVWTDMRPRSLREEMDR
ncbi:MAG: MbtH family NRPS accessory protein [Pseudonocardiales bacterium]|nr:MbtH family NRPS accessory protein [Pseudonocardiales bacterium]